MNCVGVLSFFFILLSFSQVNNVQASLDAEGIVGGADAKPGEYTYTVSLTRESHHTCGGAIIGYQHIITAAHCVTKNGVLANHPIKIIAGVNDLSYLFPMTRIEVDVAKVYIPKIFSDIKAWNADEKNEPKRTVGDIAVLLLAKSLDFGSHPNLRKLKLGNPESTYTGEAVVSGFGWIHVFTKKNLAGDVEDEISGFSFGQLRFAKTKIISPGLCSSLLSDEEVPPPGESHICARIVQTKENEPEGVCTGDSGGPLVDDGDTLIGVLSTSPVGCHEDVAPAVYTRVSSYLDFIIKAIWNAKDPQILEKQLLH